MKRNLIFLVILIILSGCHKDQSDDNYVKEYISSGIKNMAFNIGSYWIYQNDSTSKTDCTYIWNVHYNWYETYWGLEFYTLTEHYDMFYAYHCTIAGYSHYWDRIEDNYIMRNPIYNYNRLQGPIIYDTTHSGIRYLDSLPVGSRMFYKVQKASIDSTDWYTAKSIGVVRKVVHDSVDKGTWNLLRWKIVK